MEEIPTTDKAVDSRGNGGEYYFITSANGGVVALPRPEEIPPSVGRGLAVPVTVDRVPLDDPRFKLGDAFPWISAHSIDRMVGGYANLPSDALAWIPNDVLDEHLASTKGKTSAKMSGDRKVAAKRPSSANTETDNFGRQAHTGLNIKTISKLQHSSQTEKPANDIMAAYFASTDAIPRRLGKKLVRSLSSDSNMPAVVEHKNETKKRKKKDVSVVTEQKKQELELDLGAGGKSKEGPGKTAKKRIVPEEEEEWITALLPSAASSSPVANVEQLLCPQTRKRVKLAALLTQSNKCAKRRRRPPLRSRPVPSQFPSSEDGLTVPPPAGSGTLRLLPPAVNRTALRDLRRGREFTNPHKSILKGLGSTMMRDADAVGGTPSAQSTDDYRWEMNLAAHDAVPPAEDLMDYLRVLAAQKFALRRAAAEVSSLQAAQSSLSSSAASPDRRTDHRKQRGGKEKTATAIDENSDYSAAEDDGSSDNDNAARDDDRKGPASEEMELEGAFSESALMAVAILIEEMCTDMFESWRERSLVASRETARAAAAAARREQEGGVKMSSSACSSGTMSKKKKKDHGPRVGPLEYSEETLRKESRLQIQGADLSQSNEQLVAILTNRLEVLFGRLMDAEDKSIVITEIVNERTRRNAQTALRREFQEAEEENAAKGIYEMLRSKQAWKSRVGCRDKSAWEGCPDYIRDVLR